MLSLNLLIYQGDTEKILTEDALITIIILEPGQSLKQHITPVDVAFYALEGTGIVEVGEEKQEVPKDTLLRRVPGT